MTAIQKMIPRFYSTFFGLYPREFQALFADEMLIVFQMKLHDCSGTGALLLLVCKEIVGLLRGIVVAHLQKLSEHRGVWQEVSMFEIDPKEVPSSLRALFPMGAPQTPRCFGVLAGKVNSGRIFCDDPNHPTWAVVQELYDGTIYWGGSITQVTLSSVFNTLRMSGDVIAGIWLEEQSVDLLPPDPDYDGRTLEFYDRPIGKGLEKYLVQLPEGYELRRIDRQLIMQTEWGPKDVQRIGGVEEWEKQCFGFCLMRKGAILCEATVGSPALGFYEPGVFTQEAHRGKGYATLTAARLIQEIESRGGQTYWNCAKQNIASAKVARKLGYRVEKEYRCMAWNKFD